jgi:hypothetical protein
VTYSLSDPENASIKIGVHRTLPYADNRPPSTAHHLEIAPIAPAILLDLGLPEHRNLIPPDRKTQSVPEVAVDVDRHPSARKNYIWAPW